MFQKGNLFFILIFSSICCSLKAEIFSAIGELEKLAEFDKLMIRTIKSLSSHLKDEYVNQKIADWEAERELVDANVIQYITNPLNAFVMIKRCTIDIKIMDERFPEIPSKLFDKMRLILPTDEDLTGAVEGLLRLQIVYKLKSVDFAKGIIMGNKTRRDLTAHELFIIADESRRLPDQEYFAQEYMYLAFEKIMKGDFSSNELDEIAVAQLLASMFNHTADYENALWVTNSMLSKYPQNEEFLELKKVYSADHLKYGKTKVWLKNPFSEKIIQNGKYSKVKENILYSQVCRGAVAQSPKEQSELKCRYKSTSAFSQLARYKIEEANLDPYIILFVDIVSDSEIEAIIEKAKSNVTRAYILSSDNEKEKSKNRIAQLAWLKTDEIVRRLSTRTEDMTGLSQTTAEMLQVQNYGIGGHYITHWDHRAKNTTPFTGPGNRIATVLFYMSDVEQGGATTFPYLKIKINPRKGAAAFWYNLQPSGEGESRVRHAACPVLLGSKWVANKWVREHGNEFTRPCPSDFPFVEEDIVTYYKEFF